MFGFSVFLGDHFQEEKKQYIKMMHQAGFKKVFTSLHIPEEDSQTVFANLQVLGALTQQLQMELMADISIDGLRRFEIDLKNPRALRQLVEMGVTGIRMDYGVDSQTMAHVSQVMTVGLNASTLTDEIVTDLTRYHADFTNMELWHNYYPRPETGLSRQYVQAINQKWRSLGLKTVAFVPGNHHLRGPLHQGLPTLEEHREIHPLAAAIDLSTCDCDDICIGDEGLTVAVQEQFRSYLQERKIQLHVSVIEEEHATLFIGTHTNRIDDARDVIRSQEARFKEIPTITPNKTEERLKGSVTLDNQKYLRYMGELQITKTDLLADEKVNVVAKVLTEDLPLVDCIFPGDVFELKVGI
ncbi:DUF871 domain-containing protein [Candidatus Enterococcus willemsii]|uniref:Outer surface protein n=1 Tax=Candidatus Enterococcus willemsii TaxID=1857215 RepID=A0ABQ6Z3B7_9ENTE|nr:MupG family TIM beta-alpha barrel fold protein [Enterococcus sp. CU12B]KAF1306098.1 hypothetical protein BAU17_03130 [Enterococcus sp. CU12B]